MADPQAAALAKLFGDTLAPSKDVIQAAEAALKAASQHHGYSVTVLKLVASDVFSQDIRQAAAVNFKNLVKYRWAPTDVAAYGGATPLGDDEKAQIKTSLPSLMLSTPPRVQAQLSEALAIVCSHDFPRQWPTLLPELVERLTAPASDLHTINGVLATANSIFKRYRNQYSSNELVAELDASQGVFAGPLLDTLRKLSAQVQAERDPAALRVLLGSVRYAFRIFFSLNAPGLTPTFEQQLDPWMAEFHSFLVYENPGLGEADPDKEGVLDAVRSAVCQNINLFMEANEEEFAKFLQTFVSDVWGLLMRVTLKPGQDNLAMNSIRFLTTVAKSVHHRLFADQGALKQICESIVVPNLRVRPEDEEVFEMNALEYIRRDAEGSDSDTRRRAAADLVRSLTDKFPSEVTALFTGYVQAMLAEYAANPLQNWKSKDCAIYLVLALTVRGRTGAQGATKTNQLVNVEHFFTSQVLPELSSPAINENPILKADAIKFVTTFRSLLPKATLLAIFPHLIRLLGSDYNVIHSYAAIAVERLLSLKDGGALRFQPADLSALLQPLLERLFAGFKLPESGDNEYLMKAVMRVIGFVGPAIAPVGPVCLQALATMLVEVCKNPKNPGFNHYLFESVAALIKHATAGNASMVETFEQMLFPAFNHVLQQDVQEFHPYVFQIFAQLIELRAPPLPAVYMQIFTPLLSPVFWERSGNVPALVRLLQAYLAKAGPDVAAGGHLVSVLGVFQKLIASKAHDHEGFHILSAITEHLQLAAFEQFLPTIWQLLFTRLQASKTQKFLRHFLVYVSLFVCKHGPQALSSSMDKVQPGIFLMLLKQVFLPNMASVEGSGEEEKLLVVAATKVLVEFPPLQQDLELWNKLKEEAIRKLEGKGRGDANGAGCAAGPLGEEDQEEGLEELQGYSAAYAKLANASRPERPVLAEIADPRQYLESRLAGIGAAGIS